MQNLEALKIWLQENKHARLSNEERYLGHVDADALFIVYTSGGKMLLKTDNFDEAYAILMKRGEES